VLCLNKEIMRYKIGDRVKFLTEKGGGIVRKVIGPNLVSVETEDGFEVPTLTRDLIIVEANSATERLFVDKLDDTPKKQNVTEEGPAEVIIDNSSLMSSLIVYPSDRIPENFNLSIAFVPQQQNMPMVGDLDIYLINFSTYDVLFSYHSQNEKIIELMSSGKIDAFSKYFIASINREQLDAYLNGHVQVLLLHKESKALHAPVSSDMQIRGSKFYKETSYKHDKFILQKALMYQFFEFKNIPIINQLSTAEDTEVFQAKASRKKNDAILKHKISDNVAVVDMHIWELVDDHSRLTNTEMFNIQMGYFRKCLESAIENKFESVVFIHGVGTGKLKEEIIDILKEKDFIKYRPASMAEFGVGATKVEIFGGD